MLFVDRNYALVKVLSECITLSAVYLNSSLYNVAHLAGEAKVHEPDLLRIFYAMISSTTPTLVKNIATIVCDKTIPSLS